MESWTVHVVHARAKVHGCDKDDVDQVREENNASLSRLPVRGRSVKDFESVEALGGSSDTRRYWRLEVCGFGPQNQASAGLPIWVSKLRVHPVRW